MSKSLKMRGACLQTALLLQTTSLRTALENHMAWISRGSLEVLCASTFQCKQNGGHSGSCLGPRDFKVSVRLFSHQTIRRLKRAAITTKATVHLQDCQWCFSSARPATILEAPVVPKAQLSTAKATLATSTFGSAKGME